MFPDAVKPPILIVDDNALNRQAFVSILEKDYSVTEAASGREGLKLTSAQRFAVILLDVRMPGMDGFETAEQLRRFELNRETPIIFLSVHDEMMVPMMKCGFIAGATDFLFGLVDEDLLRVKVATHVALRLRDDALKTEVCQLTALVKSLQGDAPGASPAFTEKIRVAPAVLAEMQRHLGSARGW